ncbi:MAG: cytochrome c family protein, partial [Acidobacteria bacterium]|nr:cytochrome c family protein [Acidobacteriota bacterium]
GFRPTKATHIQKSELCATCHTLYTKALGPDGEVIGELPEQMPYREWLHSDYREQKSCQSCHMPAVTEEIPITSVLGEPRAGFSRHVFVGGNFFMLRMLNRYRGDLGVAALPQELEAAAVRTIKNLQSESAQLAIDRVERHAGRLDVEIPIKNLGGHKLPTAYPSRRVWLHVVVRDRNNQVVFESGALSAQGLIHSNDNDADPTRYEPHYAEINRGDQVQIYESIMVDQAGSPTTGLLSAVRFVKDNRLLPRGFDKRTAEEDIAVRGSAAEDLDFADGGDRVLYSIPLGDAEGPFQIEAELWYQPISYRWASNLREYKAMETERFVKYFDAMSSGSGVVLAKASAVR